MDNMVHNSSAFYGFDRSASAVNGERVTARISKGLVFCKAKVSLTKFRLAEQINRTLSNSGFFSSIDAASDAKDKVPTWASCTGNIGRYHRWTIALAS